MASTVKSTTLSFGMVSAPVALKKVADKKEIGFSMASPTGNGVKQVYTDMVTGEIVGGRDECLKGIFDDPKNKIGFHEVPAESIAAIDASSKIEGLIIDGYMPLSDVPFERVESAYFIAPAGKMGAVATKPLALLRDAMVAEGVAGYGKLTMTTKQRAFIVFAKDGGLFLTTLVFAEDFEQAAEAGEALAGVETDEKFLNLARTLITASMGSLDALDTLRDETRDAKATLVEKALAGEKIEAPEAVAEMAPVIDIEAALLASIAESAAPKKAAKPKAAKAA